MRSTQSRNGLNMRGQYRHEPFGCDSPSNPSIRTISATYRSGVPPLYKAARPRDSLTCNAAWPQGPPEQAQDSPPHTAPAQDLAQTPADTAPQAQDSPPHTAP